MLMNWSTIFDGVIAIGAIIFSIAQWRTGKKEVKISNVSDANSTIELFKNRAEVLEKEQKDLRGEFEAFKKESVIKEDGYKKVIAQQEDLIKTYSEILKNRNPDLENILKELKDYLQQLRDKKE